LSIYDKFWAGEGQSVLMNIPELPIRRNCVPGSLPRRLRFSSSRELFRL
jgi:hypothetical protein